MGRSVKPSSIAAVMMFLCRRYGLQFLSDSRVCWEIMSEWGIFEGRSDEGSDRLNLLFKR